MEQATYGMLKDYFIEKHHVTELCPSLFHNGEEITDVEQFIVGNCWLLSAICSIISKDPTFFQRKMSIDDDYKVTVKFHDRDIVVDGFLPCIRLRNGQVKPLTANPHEESYVPLLCKAMVKYMHQNPGDASSFVEKRRTKLRVGSDYPHYSDIDGGMPSWFYTAMYGTPFRATRTNVNVPFVRHLAAGRDIVCTAASRNGSDRNMENGIVFGHAYTVLGLYRLGHEYIIKLRNPWGRTEPTNRFTRFCSADDGVFFLDMRDFQRYFPYVFFSPTR